jgi:hypothetical protein
MSAPVLAVREDRYLNPNTRGAQLFRRREVASIAMLLHFGTSL